MEEPDKGKADAVLAASICRFGKHTAGEEKKRYARKGIPVRTVVKEV